MRNDPLRRLTRRWPRIAMLAALIPLAILDHHGCLLVRRNRDLDHYQAQTFAVLDVLDGRTVLIDRRDEIADAPATAVRLWGVAVPAVADAAASQLARFIEGRCVTLWLEPRRTRDDQGRLLAHLDLEDGTSINAALIERGLACTDERWSHSRLTPYAWAAAEFARHRGAEPRLRSAPLPLSRATRNAIGTVRYPRRNPSHPMAIETTVAKHYSIRLIIVGVLSVVFAIWGAYDLWVKIPSKERTVHRFDEVTAQLDSFNAAVGQGQTLSPADAETYDALTQEMSELTPGGETPDPPAKYDRLVSWLFILSIFGAPYCFWMIHTARKQGYRLDDDGTLTTPAGSWSAQDIADIDMSRWMAKSVAQVVHRDGARVKLDDYVQRNTHLIVGKLASERYPDQWDEQAKLIKPASEPEGTPEENAGDAPQDEAEESIGDRT